jgi:hypothetical protein
MRSLRSCEEKGGGGARKERSNRIAITITTTLTHSIEHTRTKGTPTLDFLLLCIKEQPPSATGP